MANPSYQRLPIDFWVYPDRLGVAQPSLCLFHKTADVGRPLLDALEELQMLSIPAKCMLTFAPCSRKSPLQTLKLIRTPERNELKVMNIRRAADLATIEMTDVGLLLLRNAVTSWLSGLEDFGVSAAHSSLRKKDLGALDRDSGELWFWGPGYYSP